MKRMNQVLSTDFQLMTESEAMNCNGGSRFWEIVVDVATFAVSPALGVLNLGIKEGYREAAAEAAAHK
jgi:hypothetical protein